ncbi:transcription cofactor HES-6-like [Arapaima gigas]
MTASNAGNVSERTFSAKEERKLRKPLIEKRRRERINCSLEQLKGLMVEAYNLDQSKLEKADVLEITVQHMEALQRSHGAGASGSSVGFESRQRYSSGYIQCMHEVHNLLLSCPGLDQALGVRLLNHLLKSLPHISAENTTGSRPGSAGGHGNHSTTSPLPPSPTHSPLSLPLAALAPPTPASPSSASSPHRASGYQDGADSGRGDAHPGSRHPALPGFLLGGDPSMWRPW